MNRLSRLTTTVGVCLTAAFVFSTLWIVFRYAHAAPYADSRDMLGLFRAYREGASSFSLYWEPWNQHRIVVPKLLYLADFLAVSGTGALLRILNVVFQGTVVAFLLLALRHSGLPRREKGALTACAAGACFWLVQSGNLGWGFQVAWFLAHAAVAGAAYFASGFDRQGAGARLMAAAACATLATYSLGSGLLVWFVVAFMLAKAGARPLVQVGWLAGAALVIGIYFVGLFGPAAPVHADDFMMLRVALYFLVLVGGPLSRFNQVAGGGLGVVGLLLMMLLTLRFFFGKTPDFLMRFLMVLAGYAFLSLAAMAVGRSHFDLATHAASSRYYTVILLFWCSILLAGWVQARPYLPHGRGAAVFRRMAFLVIVVILAAGQALSVPERRARYLRADEGALALAVGVNDAPAVAYFNGYADPERLFQEDEFLRAVRAGYYSAPWARLMGRPVSEAGVPDISRPIRGESLEFTPVGSGLRQGHFVKGRVASDTADAPEVLLIAREGRVVGFARTFGRGCRGCFSGYVHGEREGLEVYAPDPDQERTLLPVTFR